MSKFFSQTMLHLDGIQVSIYHGQEHEEHVKWLQITNYASTILYGYSSCLHVSTALMYIFFDVLYCAVVVPLAF